MKCVNSLARPDGVNLVIFADISTSLRVLKLHRKSLEKFASSSQSPDGANMETIASMNILAKLDPMNPTEGLERPASFSPSQVGASMETAANICIYQDQVQWHQETLEVAQAVIKKLVSFLQRAAGANTVTHATLFT